MTHPTPHTCSTCAYWTRSGRYARIGQYTTPLPNSIPRYILLALSAWRTQGGFAIPSKDGKDCPLYRARRRGPAGLAP